MRYYQHLLSLLLSILLHIGVAIVVFSGLTERSLSLEGIANSTQVGGEGLNVVLLTKREESEREREPTSLQRREEGDERESIEPRRYLVAEKDSSLSRQVAAAVKPSTASVEAERQRDRDTQGSMVERVGTIRSVQRALNMLIDPCYPRRSRERGEEGRAELALHKVGEQIHVVLIESTGFRRLDRCAIEAVESALKRSQLREEILQSGLEEIPLRAIEFRLE